jgi:cupin fold WbuC family metalloprotein
MRQNLNIHKNYDDVCQRLFNAIDINSYIRPHRHSRDPKTESLFAMKGMFALVIFDDSGKPINVVKFGTERFDGHLASGVELLPDTWHTIIALTEGAVLLEIKAGPFDPGAAKELASWAPEEGSSRAQAYLESLRGVVAEWEFV